MIARRAYSSPNSAEISRFIRLASAGDALAVEIAIVGYTNDPPLQLFYLLIGAAITSVGLGWRASLRSSESSRPG